MDYCTNCGSPLAGAMRFCASCGFRVPEGKLKPEDVDPSLDRTSFVGAHEDEDEEVMEVLEEARESRPPPPPAPEPQDRPSHLEKEEPIRDRGFTPSCDVCGKGGEAVCIFCDKGLCAEHSKKMAVMVNNIPSSRTVAACESCGKSRVGQVPTAPTAREADFLYAIKPYHEWGYVDD